MSHSAGMSVLTIASYIGVLIRTLMMWTLGNAALCAASNRVAVSPPSSVMRVASSLDHLVGADEQRWGQFEAERLRSIEVED
jgi:hypothetical protein